MINESGGSFAGLAHLLVKARRLDEALTNIDRALALEPSVVGHHRLRGSVLEQMERFGEAERTVVRALELLPNNVDLASDLLRLELTDDLKRIRNTYLAQLRNLRDTSNHIEQAISSAEEIVRLTPGAAGDLATLAHLLVKARRLDEALTNIDRAIALEPNEVGHHRLRGSVLEQLERFEEAEQTVERALELLPINIDLASDLLRMELTEDLNRIRNTYVGKLRNVRDTSSDIDQAISSASAIVRRAPDSPRDFSTLADLMVKARRLDDALINIDRAIALEPRDHGHYRLRASVLEQKTHFKLALQSAKKAYELMPGNPELLADIRRIRRKRYLKLLKVYAVIALFKR